MSRVSEGGNAPYTLHRSNKNDDGETTSQLRYSGIVPSWVSCSLVLGYSFEHVEVIGKRLPYTLRVVNGDGRRATSCEREGHRHAMVIIRVDGG